MRVLLSKYSFCLVVISFFLMIFAGSLLLSLPGILKNQSLLCIDAFFIATSMITGIGVSPIALNQFTTIGKIVLMVLMYVGNIGILIILLGIIFYFATYSIEWYSLTTELFTIVSIRTIAYLFKIIFISTILVQIFGVSAFYLLSKYLLIDLSLVDALFLSINFFCNVGLPIESILPALFYTNIWYYIISIIIILIGSCGFLFLFECLEYSKQEKSNKLFSFSFTSQLLYRTYFYTTIIFWGFYFFIAESHFSLFSLVRSLFAAISLRSCGMSPYDNLDSTIAFITAIYGLFGGGVLGPCGGIKSSILGIILYTFLSMIKKYDTVVIYNKKISWQLVSFAHIFLFYTIGLATIISIIIDICQYHTIQFVLIYSDILSLIGSGALWSSFITEAALGEKIMSILLMIFAKIAVFGVGLYLGKLKKSELTYPEAKLIII
jgi:Trk-type K+ transport system membrane component